MKTDLTVTKPGSVREVRAALKRTYGSLAAQVFENIQLKDELKQTEKLLSSRPRDKRLAIILSRWMNHHQKKREMCRCDLCIETKVWLDQIGDPVIWTRDGWVPVEDREEFRTRDIASELRDNVLKIRNGSYETEVAG